MEFALKKAEQSPADILSDRVYAAMETGNASAARAALAEASEDLDAHVYGLRVQVLGRYGVRL